MYVDDSGNPSANDGSKHYVISGVIVHERDLFQMEKNVQAYKRKHFVGAYGDAEIHVHEIYKGKGKFSSLTLQKKYELLDALYDTIRLLPITVISVGIDKQQMQLQHPLKSVFSLAWTFLVERFDNFIDDNSPLEKGLIIVDQSSKMPEKEICRIVSSLRRSGSGFQSIDCLVEEPIFIKSDIREGIQLADACAYCTLKQLNGYQKFVPYWNVLHGKLRRSSGGKVDGYGLKIFPK